MDALEHKAALLALGKLSADDVITTISALMSEGFYADECLDALDSSPATLGEVLPAFNLALKHYGIMQPDKEQAFWQLIEYHARQIVSEDDPLRCLENLIDDVYWDFDFYNAAKNSIGDSHDIERLIGIYCELEDVLEHSTEKNFYEKYGETLVELKNNVRSEAQRWLAAHLD